MGILCRVLMLVSAIAMDTKANTKNHVQSKLQEIKNDWHLAGGKYCSGATMNVYDHPSDSTLDSTVFSYNGKPVAFDVFKNRTEPVYIAVNKGGVWREKQAPFSISVDFVVIEAWMEAGFSRNDMVKCAEEVFGL